jgi:L-Ala-D/L-Glu epimerase / N-acetyl-D-glutamate racemase
MGRTGLKRRDLLKTAGLAAAAGALPGRSAWAAAPKTAGPTTLRTEVVRLKLRHTWTTTMSSSDFRDTLHLRFSRDGLTGTGEGAPIVRYNEDARSAQKAVESVAPALASGDPRAYRKLLATSP